MISLVIADDEERICRLITALGEWDRLGIRVAATASNGIEALDYIRQEQVDILITDIRMPGLGGMELIREVNQVSPQTRIIIISGYSNFEYAQTAIKYGVRGYLLKPINRQELNDTLQKQAEEILAERDSSEVIQVIREENEIAVRRTRKLLAADLFGNPALNVTGENLRDYYHFRFSEGNLYVLIVKLLGNVSEAAAQAASADKSGIQPAVMEMYRERVEEILTNQFRDITEDLVTGWHEQTGVCIFGSAARGEEIRRAARESVKRILLAQESLGLSGLSAGLGVPAAEPAALPAAMDSARKAALEHFIRGSGRVFSEDVRRETIPEGSLLDHFTRDISPALEMMDPGQVGHVIDQLRREADAVSGIHGWEILDLVRQAGIMLLMRLEVPGQRRIREEFYRATDTCSTEEELFDALRSFAAVHMEMLAVERQDNSNRAVRLAKQYIQQHYMEQLTLEAVAGQVELTEAYFSVLFKKETGEGFAKYLSSVRLDMAKRLLRETSYPVAEICRRVGYNDVKHFTKIFEKSSGVTPAAYRKLYG